MPSQPGDHFLAVGDSLRVPAGDALVLEAWHMPANETLYFDGGPLPLQAAAAKRLAVRGRWLQVAGLERGFFTRTLDFAANLGAACAVFTVLAARFIGSFLTGATACARKAQLKAKRAQGCMASGESIASSGAL